jgi:hypothetical protein
MPANVKKDSLLVTFCHDDEYVEEAPAASAKEALEIARGMLAKRTELFPGDELTVWLVPPRPRRWGRARQKS